MSTPHNTILAALLSGVKVKRPVQRKSGLAKALAHVCIYDNGGKTFDRFTAVYMLEQERNGLFAAVGMSERPFHPQGFGQHCTAQPGRHLGRRITFEQLPADCQKLIRQDLNFPA